MTAIIKAISGILIPMNKISAINPTVSAIQAEGRGSISITLGASLDNGSDTCLFYLKDSYSNVVNDLIDWEMLPELDGIGGTVPESVVVKRLRENLYSLVERMLSEQSGVYRVVFLEGAIDLERISS